MPWLVIETPDGQTQQVELGAQPLLVGRADEMDVTVADPKVSARHLRIRPLGDGEGWVVRDLGSTRGTLQNGRRILRAEAQSGDVLELGGSRLRFADAPPSPPPSPVVGGTLDFKPAPGSPPPAAPPPASAPPAAMPPAAPEAPPRRLDPRAVRMAVLWVVVGLGALGGVFAVLGPQVRAARERASVLREVREVLGTVDLGIDAFGGEVADFVARHPDAPEGEKLDALVTSFRAREADRVAKQHRLLGLTEDLYGLPDSEARGELLALDSTAAAGSDLARQIDAALDALDRRYDAAEQAALETLLAGVDRQIAAGNPAAALRQLTAFRAAWPNPAPSTLTRLREVEDRTIDAVKSLADHAVAEAEATADAGAARRILALAYRGLAGTPQADRIAELLRFTRGAGGRTPSSGETEEPTEPTDEPEPQILIDAAKAEALASARRWREAMVGFEKLVEKAEPGLLRKEWETRTREMVYILSLVDALADAASSGKGRAVDLPSGRARVRAADVEGVVLERGGREEHVAWSAVGDGDLLPLLTPADPTPTQRLGLAVLAATLGDRDAFTAVLLPLFEPGDASAEANALVARYLHGRSAPPEGGYRAHRGRLLDPVAYREALAEEQIAKLRDKALGILARIHKDPSLKKLEKMQNLRAQLDERRRYALLAIFDEKHYPYPADKSSRQYQAVQREIDRRVESVRETWDDPYKFELTRDGRLARPLQEWDEVLAEIRKLGGDTRELETQLAPIATYLDQGPLTIRDFWLNDAERKLLAYNDWVMDTYNPARTEVATEAEREQTLVTNRYRRMMGYMVAVMPGPADYEAIDDDNVARILDAGRIQGAPQPLYAVRIDDRLVRSSRGHSEDMATRGFFNHYAPPNPQTGAPSTSPFDRMQAAGYAGRGMSENIVMGASNAQEAHDRWCHSSGHHRNILSLWTDQGVGRSGRYWTQNYGTGGGAKPEIPATERAEPRGATNGR